MKTHENQWFCQRRKDIMFPYVFLFVFGNFLGGLDAPPLGGSQGGKIKRREKGRRLRKPSLWPVEKISFCYENLMKTI